jgi:hypothetical protein
LVPSHRQRDEHPAGATTQLKDRVTCLSSQIKPERKIFQVQAMMSVVQLWEHFI